MSSIVHKRDTDLKREAYAAALTDMKKEAALSSLICAVEKYPYMQSREIAVTNKKGATVHLCIIPHSHDGDCDWGDRCDKDMDTPEIHYRGRFKQWLNGSLIMQDFGPEALKAIADLIENPLEPWVAPTPPEVDLHD
jgi:hypothetical protein